MGNRGFYLGWLSMLSDFEQRTKNKKRSGNILDSDEPTAVPVPPKLLLAPSQVACTEAS